MTATRVEGPRPTLSFANMSSGRPYDARRLALPASLDREWAWGGSRGDGVRVCIIDSGLRPDFEPASAIEARLTVDSDHGHAIVPDDLGDAAHHGSDCAFIVNGMAPGATITSVRTLGAGLGGSSPTLLAALGWAVDQRFHVINLSLSTVNLVAKFELHDLVDRAVFNDVAIVAAAHNRAVSSFPWQFSSVFSCGSHSSPDPGWLEVNPRPPAEFFARGVRVAVPREGGRSALVSGNSFATPHLTGLIARIRSKHPHLSLAELRHVLTAVTDNLSDERSRS